MTQVAIIGAGPGGLAAGMILAANGYEVDIYEKQQYVGGRTSSFTKGEYTFDLGPTFFSMTHVLEEIFTKSGRNLHDYVELIELDPMYSLVFDNLTIRASRNEEKMFAEIEKNFPGNGPAYKEFMKDTRKKLAALSPILQEEHASLFDYLRLRSIKALPQLEVGKTLYDVLAKYFDDERLILSFTFQSKYLGMSPWECPGAFSILSFMEHEYGVFHPRGGLNQITKAMAAVAEEHGARIHLDSGVQKIDVQNGKAESLLLESGEVIKSDHIVMNADFANSMSTLIDDKYRKKYSDKKLSKKKYSCSTFMIYAGVNKKIDLDHHTVFFSADYKKNVEEITKLGKLSDDPSIYVHNASVTDNTLAPEGKSALYILAPVANNFSEINWEEKKQKFRDLIMEEVASKLGMPDLEQHIEVEEILTPFDWEKDKLIYQGATFNLAHNLGQMMYFRPHNQFDDIKGIWLTGGGTHPGSGLPTIFESAKITSKLIMQSDRRKVNS
ncbi:phytoene desaturase family protein [Alkalicoccus halolimnae]|uniref:Phytoene desaturase family protein n=1 Tax=Alkalicoccus halolimnae TaxID=1667239 RepID=A0A5C7FFH2_9BACI|nr:phytoene desaturase family protein [Alkalicoccus halolimnae]TXF83074.1 phytoene desaturase [Alkalicoccus halolimnae]